MVMNRKQRTQLGVFIAQKRRARREQERSPSGFTLTLGATTLP